MNTLKQKINRANGILVKLRYYVKFIMPSWHSNEICMSNLGTNSEWNIWYDSTYSKQSFMRIVSLKQFIKSSEPL